MNESISWHLRLHRPQSIPALCARFGIHLVHHPDDCGSDFLALMRAIDEEFNLVVPLPDGRLTHVLSALNGIVLTERTRVSTSDRVDLWTSPSLRPLIDLAREAPLALADGGQLQVSSTYGQVLLGPPGWLPSTQPGELLAFTIDNGVVSVRTVVRDDLDLATPEQRRLRGLLASHTNQARVDEPQLHVDVTFMLAMARIEDPELLKRPTLPLQELLHEPIDDRRPEMWRDLMAWRQDETVSFQVIGMPEALYQELSHRAAHYGTSFDQFTIAVLGHLAWRTPFAEDMGPWDSWASDRGTTPTRLRVLDGADDD